MKRRRNRKPIANPRRKNFMPLELLVNVLKSVCRLFIEFYIKIIWK
jgi:hypothetical protein